MKKINNIIYYMRKRLGLSQQELAKRTKLTANDICRLENGNLGAGVEKGIALAKFLSISVDSIISNNFEEVFASFSQGPETSRKMLERINNFRKQCDELGHEGEDWVYQQEVKKLRGTVYANAVNQNFADDDEAHFDILSYDRNGNPIYIDVKATNGKAGKKFYISAKEKERAEDCLAKGECYEIHRVHHLSNPKKRGRLIITAEDLFKNYKFEADSYGVIRKLAV